MKTVSVVVGVVLVLLVSIGGTVAGAGGPHDKACVAEIRNAGDWGKTLNPGKATFISGTAGDDKLEIIEAGVVFCGLGGNDTVVVNNGWFYGGGGIDTVWENNGIVDGGENTDVVLMNGGVFRGRNAADFVHVNKGVFDGGPGIDGIEGENSGTCIDVEEGC
jgi:hypothetical protein